MSTPSSNPRLRPISPTDNGATAEVIRQTLKEFGADREGFAFVDDELNALAEHFQPPRATYLVVEHDGHIVGGAGFGPLLGCDPHTAELKKMYLLPHARGLGLGWRLLDKLLPLAREAGYRQIYLETTATMRDAMKLYEKAGFHRLDQAMGATGHFGCEIWYLRSL